MRKENEGGISDGVLTPGCKVSVNLYVAGIGGRLPHTKGSEDEDRKYAGGGNLSRHIFRLSFRQSSTKFDRGHDRSIET